MRRWWTTLFLTLLAFTGSLQAQFIPGIIYVPINPPPTLPIQFPWLVIEQTHAGRTDLLLCNSVGGKRTTLEGSSYYTKCYLGSLGGRVIFTRSGYGSAGTYSIDLVSVKLDGTGQVTLASGFMSGADPTAAKGKVLFDTRYGRVIYERTNWTDGSHDIYSVFPDGSLSVGIASDARDERLKAVMNGYVIYELQWSATDTDLYAVITDGTGKSAISGSGDDETFEGLSDTRIYYHRKMGGNLTLWCASLTGSNTMLAGGVGDTYKRQARDGRVLLVRHRSTTDELLVQNEDGSGLTLLNDFGGFIAGEFKAHFVGSYAVFPTAWDGSGLTTAISRVALSGGAPIVSYASSTPFGWTETNDRSKLVIQTDDSKQCDFWVQYPDGSGRVNLATTSWDDQYVMETGGRIIFTRASYHGDQTDLYSINLDGSGLSALGTSVLPESFGQIVDSMVFYQLDQASSTDLRRVYVDGTGNSDNWTVPGSARIVGWFY